MENDVITFEPFNVTEHNERLIDTFFDRLAGVRNEVEAAHADDSPYTE